MYIYVCVCVCVYRYRYMYMCVCVLGLRVNPARTNPTQTGHTAGDGAHCDRALGARRGHESRLGRRVLALWRWRGGGHGALFAGTYVYVCTSCLYIQKG